MKLLTDAITGDSAKLYLLRTRHRLQRSGHAKPPTGASMRVWHDHFIIGIANCDGTNVHG
jgi:hypothetical protein